MSEKVSTAKITSLSTIALMFLMLAKDLLQAGNVEAGLAAGILGIVLLVIAIYTGISDITRIAVLKAMTTRKRKRKEE